MADYTELCKSLDIDLERHDQLMDTLGSMYNEIYLSQDNRPEGMGYFDFVVSEVHGLRVQELVDHKKEGGKVIATFCIFVPEEVALAANAISVGLCAGSQFWVPDGERLLPRNLCPLIKAAMGAKTSNTCPYYQTADLVVGETTCDGKKKCWEVLNEYIPIHIMDVPQMKREKDIKHWGEEIQEYVGKVEELTGQKVTPQKLAEKIDLVNKKRAVLERIYSTRKAEKTPISGKDALLLTQIAFYDNPERYIEKMEILAEELEKRVEEGVSPFPENTPRVMIAGTPQAIPNWQLHHIIETNGGAVVCEETCIGTRYFENQVVKSEERLDAQLDALAERYMKINCSCFTPNSGRVEDVLRLAKEFNVDGVVYYNLQFCHGYNVEYRKVEKALKEAGIPVIMIETDYSGNDEEQIRTRIEAFIEMIR